MEPVTPINENYTVFIDKYIISQKDNPRDNYGPFVIPNDKYFVLGDNRDESDDSRYEGFLDKDLILGKALVIYGSFDSIKNERRKEREGIK